MKRVLIGAAAALGIGAGLSALYLTTNKCRFNASFVQQAEVSQAAPKDLSSQLRASAQIRLMASPEVIFAYISSAELLPEWMPDLAHVSYDHSNSISAGRLDRGGQRKMLFGSQEETEVIVEFEPFSTISYQIIEGVPLKNHAAIMTVTASEAGGSILTWSQYFDLKQASISGWLMPFLVRRFLHEAQENLIEKFGGEAIATCRPF